MLNYLKIFQKPSFELCENGHMFLKNWIKKLIKISLPSIGEHMPNFVTEFDLSTIKTKTIACKWDKFHY